MVGFRDATRLHFEAVILSFLYKNQSQFLLWSLVLFSTISISFSLKCSFLLFPSLLLYVLNTLGGGLHKVICRLHERNYYPDLMYPFHICQFPVFIEVADGVDSVQLQLDTSSSSEEKVLSNKEDIYSLIYSLILLHIFDIFYKHKSVV